MISKILGKKDKIIDTFIKLNGKSELSRLNRKRNSELDAYAKGLITGNGRETLKAARRTILIEDAIRYEEHRCIINEIIKAASEEDIATKEIVSMIVSNEEFFTKLDEKYEARVVDYVNAFNETSGKKISLDRVLTSLNNVKVNIMNEANVTSRDEAGRTDVSGLGDGEGVIKNIWDEINVFTAPKSRRDNQSILNHELTHVAFYDYGYEESSTTKGFVSINSIRNGKPVQVNRNEEELIVDDYTRKIDAFLGIEHHESDNMSKYVSSQVGGIIDKIEPWDDSKTNAKNVRNLKEASEAAKENYWKNVMFNMDNGKNPFEF
ncbi:MAG: hypothetical protein N4A47_04000 [Clostridia bacterium]|jgi:hypothetical protein|nr:hypothetical protein [Clostridia bacterium]